MKFVRNVLILLAVSLTAVYAGGLVLLLIYQRDLLFIGNDEAIEPPPAHSIYRVRSVTEPGGVHLMIWQAPAIRPDHMVFVFFYGNGANLYDFAQTGEMLNRAGYGVVLGAYRGYSGNTGAPSEDGLMADARAILASIGTHHGPIVLWGHSLGSGIAARMASEGRASALILESAYTSVVDVAALRFPIYPVHLLMKDRFDTGSLIAKIDIPVLILHGTMDDTVPFEMGKTLAREFGRRATFIPFPGVQHEPHRENLAPLVIAWLQNHRAGIWGRK